MLNRRIFNFRTLLSMMSVDNSPLLRGAGELPGTEDVNQRLADKVPQFKVKVQPFIRNSFCLLDEIGAQ